MRRRGVYVMLTLCGLVTAALTALLVISLTGNRGVAEAVTQTVSVDLSNNQGEVLGNFGTTAWTEQTFMQFRGIPYAEPPIEEMRFRPPVARSPWTNTFSALNFGQRCPVITNLDDQLSDAELEDCLNLSVYTKNLTANQPVMFYIYGGGYYNGSAEDHPPNYILEKDIVLVVPNYRVGALGWLTTFTDEFPGNAPIADILMALEWVQLHINRFGGNPQKVTIFGQSAGAGIASSLLLSPKSGENLFQQAIVQSGSIFANWAINKDPLGQARRICRQMGCLECDDHDQIFKCLRHAKVLDILRATTTETFSPVMGDLPGILPQHPSVLVTNYQRKIPLLTGFTEHDGSFVLASYYDGLVALISNVSSLSVRQFSQGINHNLIDDKTGLTDNLLNKMLFKPPILNSKDHKLALPAYFDLTSTIYMKSPVITLAQSILAQQPTTPVYVYSFEYEGEFTRFGYELGNSHYPFNGGVHHSNDNIYLFATHPLQGQDTVMAQKMVDIWTSFAIDGVPRELSPLTSQSGPYNRLNLMITEEDDMLESLTAAIDDPDNDRLQRDDLEF